MSKPTNTEPNDKILSLEKEIEECKASERELKNRAAVYEAVFPDNGKPEQLEDRRNEHRDPYKRLFQDIPQGILLVDAQACIVDANDQALKTLGYSHEELTGMTVNDLVHPDDLDAQPLITTRDIADPDRKMTLERLYLCKNGSYLPVRVQLSLFPNDTLLTVFQDISQRMAADKALRSANEALEVVYRCSNAAIISLDANACVSFWNPAAEKMFGWTQQEVIGNPYPAVPEEFQEEYQSYFAEKIDGKAFTDVEVVRQRKDGTRFYVSATTGPMRNENGVVVGLTSVMIDIAERKQAEEALQQSEERYRSLVENTNDGYFICDVPTGQFRFLNQRMCDLLGYTQEEALAITLWDVIAAEDHPAVKANIDFYGNSARTNSAPHAYKAVQKNKTTFRVEISTTLVPYEEKPAIQGLLRDVTEKERLHAKLQQAQRLESVGTLAGGVAHDFNNLLMAIQGNASLALTKIEPTHSAHDKLKNITTYVQDAAGLTKQLLGFARGGKYEVKATDLNILVDKTTQMFGRTKKEITIHIHPQADIWLVAVDRGQIEQVLLNLFVNAWQAMPNGGQLNIQTTNVVLDTKYAHAYNVSPGKYVKTSVTDTGIGMDKAIQTKIFEPFFTTKDRARGTGLGLASAYGIVKNHDGIINVYSERGKGTTFTFCLPADEITLSQEADDEPTPLSGTETILIVDDEEMILEVGREMLNELGYRPLEANSGQEALEIYLQEGEKIDLIILDMIMPEMSGGETYNKLKQISPAVKVLLASGYSLNGKASSILDSGCNGFIQKPFNMEELSRKIREVLDIA